MVFEKRSQFSVLWIEAGDELAELVARLMSRVFPEATLLQATSLSEATKLLHPPLHRPKLILFSNYETSRPEEQHDFIHFLRSPLVKSIPVLLLDYEQVATRVNEYYQAGIAAYHLKPETLTDWQTLIEQIRQFWFVFARTVPS